MITNTLPALAADALPWTAAEAAKLRLNNRTCISSRSGSNSTLWASSSSTVRPSTLRTSSIIVHPLSRHGVGSLILQHAPLYVKGYRQIFRKNWRRHLQAPSNLPDVKTLSENFSMNLE